MKTGGLIEAFAMQAKKTPVEFLTDLIARHSKLQTMELELGMSYQAIKAAMARHGITRHKSKDFEYQGVTDSLHGHCRRLGLPIKNTEVDGSRFGLTKPQALDYALYRQTWDKYRGNHEPS